MLDKSSADEVIELAQVDISQQGTAAWSFGNASITGEGGEGYILSVNEYEDFILSLEFFPDENVNSGIFIRCPNQEVGATSCYEINIWDNHVNQEFRTGAIVTHGPPLKHVDSIGKWNEYIVKAKGNRIQVWLNGQKTADLKDSKSERGNIALQANNGNIQFRNLLIKRI